jgi:peptide/nickel transport system substrate-binding protein
MLRRTRHHFADERLFARHGMDFTHFRHLAQAFGESVVSSVWSRITTYEGDEFEAKAAAVELRAVAANVAASFEALYAVVHGWGLEADERPQFSKGRAPIALKSLQQRKVEVIEVVGDNHIRQIRISCRKLFGDLTISPVIRSSQWILALAVLVACTKAGGPAVPPPGVVRFALAADPSTLDPLFMHPDAALVEAQIARLAFEPFVDFDRSGKPVPALLDRLPTVSRDGRTIVYHLRAVRWSDGAPVTSGDVLFTLHAILDPRNPVRSTQGYDLIDRAVALDPRTIAFHLKRAWAPAALGYFSYGTTPQFVLPAHVLRTQRPLDRAPFGAAPSVGDGPYSFVSWQRGNALRYRANPRYWRGKPAVAELEVRIVTDPGTNLLMLRTGALDWNLIAPVQYSMIAADSHLRFAATLTAVVAGLVMNTSHAPLNDVRVRRAIAMSIDREAISEKITLGKYPVTNMIQPKFSWAYDPNVRQPSYDPSGADAAFDVAGWQRGPDGMRRRDGVPMHFVYVAFPETVSGMRIATVVQAALRDRGVAVTVKSISNAQLFLPQTGTLATGNFDLAYVPFTMGADPDDSDILSCGAPSNYMHWCDSVVDRLERAALSSVSQSQRRTLYGAIARRVADQVPLLYLFNARYVYAYRDRLAGFAPNAFLPTWNAWAWRI